MDPPTCWCQLYLLWPDQWAACICRPYVIFPCHTRRAYHIWVLHVLTRTAKVLYSVDAGQVFCTYLAWITVSVLKSMCTACILGCFSYSSSAVILWHEVHILMTNDSTPCSACALVQAHPHNVRYDTTQVSCTLITTALAKHENLIYISTHNIGMTESKPRDNGSQSHRKLNQHNHCHFCRQKMDQDHVKINY